MRIVTALSTAAIWSFAGTAGWVALLLMLSLTASGDGHVAAWQKAVFTALYFPVEVLNLGESGKGLSAALVVSAWILIPGFLLLLIVPQLDIYYYADEDDPLVFRLWPIVTYIALAALIVWFDAKTAAERAEKKQRESAVRQYAGQQPRIADLAGPSGPFSSAPPCKDPAVDRYTRFVSVTPTFGTVTTPSSSTRPALRQTGSA